MKKAYIFGIFLILAPPLSASRLLAPSAVTVGSDPRGLVSGDLNGDGFDDAVVANFGSGTLIGQACPADAGSIQVFRGSTQGLQLFQTIPLSGDAPRGLALADTDLDGRPDILATLYCSGQLAVFKQASDGGFSQSASLAVGSQPVGVAVLPRAGGAWVAVAAYGSNTVTLFKAGQSGLQPLGSLPVGANPTDLEFYAPSPQGPVTLLVAAYSANQVQRFGLGPDGTVLNSVVTAVAGQPCKIVVGDVNGDGLPDAAVARFADSAISVFLGLPGGGLADTAQAVALQGSHPNGLAVGPLGASSRLVSADRDSDQADIVSWTPAGLSATAALRLPDAAGNTGTFGPVESALADVNGDGLQDILITHMRSGRLFVVLQAPTGAPSISSPTHPDPKGWSAQSDLVADFSVQGELDPVQGYRVLLDDSPFSLPPADAPVQASAEARFSGLSTGVHYLHVQAVDASGKAGDTAHYRVGITAQMAKENVYNYPNPSRDGQTTIRFPLLTPAAVQIRIHDEVGALVWSRDLSPAETVGGLNTLLWDGRNGAGREVGNGGYILTVQSGDVLVTKKIAIIR